MKTQLTTTSNITGPKTNGIMVSPISNTTNIMTVDVEDWYQSSLDVLGPEHANLPRPVFPSDRVVINTRRLLNIFDEYNVKAVDENDCSFGKNSSKEPFLFCIFFIFASFILLLHR